MTNKIRCICQNLKCPNGESGQPKIFYILPCKIKEGRGKYCCKKCSGARIGHKKFGKEHHSWKGGLIKCICQNPACKKGNNGKPKEFDVFPSVIKNGHGKYCCRECKESVYSILFSGEGSPFKGKTPWNKGTKGVMIAWNKGLTKEIDSRLIMKPEQKKKIGEASKGRHLSEETKQKIRNANIGDKSPTKRPEVRAKMREARLYQIMPFKDTKIETTMQNILIQNEITFEKHKPILGQPDIFIEPNLCIFCDGDYWHANPLFYKENDIMSKGKLAKEIRNKDKEINIRLINRGYKVLRFWESDIKNNTKECFEKIYANI